MKLLGSLLIRCVFTKKTEGAKKGQKFVKIGTGKNIGSPEQGAMQNSQRRSSDGGPEASTQQTILQKLQSILRRKKQKENNGIGL